MTGSLSVASWIRTDRVVTLDASLIVESIARAADAPVEEAVRRLGRFLRHT